MHIRHVVAAAIAALCPWPALAGPACADLVLVDADIRTLDDALPRARALATIGARIVAIGDEAAVRPLACDATRARASASSMPRSCTIRRTRVSAGA